MSISAMRAAYARQVVHTTRVRHMGPSLGEILPSRETPSRPAYATLALLERWPRVLDRSIWTAIVSKDEEWWIGWIAELPGVNAQERTRDALLESLAEVLAEALRMNRDQARALACEGYEQVPLAL